MMYALIGSGRLARHFKFYFDHLGLPLKTWSRKSSHSLPETLDGATHVLLAVSDHALEPVRDLIGPGPRIVHFSGARVVDGTVSAHPLMTFGEDLQDLDWYRQIPFLVEQGFTLDDVLPGLPNPFYNLPPQAKSFYHALCSLAGNSTFLLWKAIGDRFENELGLPRELLNPFLHQVVQNAAIKGDRGFTGPLSRGDWATVRGHLHSLKDAPELHSAYQNYLALAEQRGFALPEDIR